MTTQSTMPDFLPWRDTNTLGNCTIKQLLGRQIVLHDPEVATQFGRNGVFFTGIMHDTHTSVVGSIQSSSFAQVGKLEFKVNNGTLNETALTIDGEHKDVTMKGSLTIGDLSSGQQAKFKIGSSNVLTQTALQLKKSSDASSPTEVRMGTWRFVMQGENLNLQYDSNGNGAWTDKVIFRPDAPSSLS